MSPCIMGIICGLGMLNIDVSGDQQLEGVSLTSETSSTGSGEGGGGPLQDPAILLVREMSTTTTTNRNIIRYSREQLLKLRDVPAAKKRPDFLNTTDTSSLSIFDPDRWNFDKRKPSGGSNSAPSEGDAAPESQQRGPISNRRSAADPRERLRKECVGGGGDGIVLSPQRRSFNSGCFVPAGRQTSAGGSGQTAGQGGGGQGGRSHSPVGGKGSGDGHLGLREIQTGAPPSSGNRRIGSGRILRDSSWDFPEKQSDTGDDYVASKYERRTFGGGFDRDRDRENNKDRRNNGRYGRKISETREIEEPEWFSSGPISQNDTIELRGFDDDKPISKKKVPPSNSKRPDKWSKKKDNQQETIDENGGISSALQANAEEDAQKEGSDKRETKQAVDRNKEDKGRDDKEGDKHTATNEHGFNFDDILECQSIPGLLPNGVGNEAEIQAKSRFSRWFKQDSPEKQTQSTTNAGNMSRHSSLQSDDDHHLIIKDLLKDISEPGGPPGDSEAYFAPISPAGNTSMGAGGPFSGAPSGRPHHHQQQPPQQQHQQLPQQQGLSIMDLLRAGGGAPGNKGPQQHQAQTGHQGAVDMLKQPPIAGKILSLDELEAKIRQNTEASSGIPPQKHQQQPPTKPDEDMTAAFKKLLAQAQAGGHPAASNGPMSKPQPMSLLEMLNHSQQQDEAARMAAAAAAAHHQGHSGHHNLMGGGPVSPAAPTQQPPNNSMHHMNAAAVGELTLKLQQAQQYHQQQQQKQQMEMFNKLINAATSAGQMRLSPLQHDLGPQQSRDLLNRPEAQAILQAYCVSPILATSPNTLTVPALHQRIPSPRELQVHTQNILQRALIKKKLEEQQENYRKKQELQQQRERGSSPANVINPSTGMNNVQSSNVGTTNKSVGSPTPLAFTPTSVLRKMTADKDDAKEVGKNGQEAAQVAAAAAAIAKAGGMPQGRAVTGVRPPPQQQVQPQPQQQWGGMQFGGSVKQPVGRPIVKANNYQSQAPQEFFSQHQQQQQRIFNQAMQAAVAAQSQNQQMDAVRKQIGRDQYGYQSSNQQFAQHQQQLTQQQLRAQHQHRPANQQTIQAQQQQQQQQQQQGSGRDSAWQQFLNSNQQSQPSRSSGANNSTMTSNSTTSAMAAASRTSGGGAISPATGNQLARWFSPDLLERARGGELPSTAGLAQHAMSLEEIERQTAPPVHN
ncbi:unnamed protein product [Callosobruchus maculatus]|uniref:Eukaryotic translation initiation factor 4E transporter n=1 Tax=Callosobruchus maculatus TaxID=64391 RepID=A0A653D635_CALMS|nr:unnamed protein product [Callosobruchus maculatus]